MKIDFKNCSEEELWKYVATELAQNNIDVILVGGAVVSIYTDGAYHSGDLDFVINDFKRDRLNDVLINNLGFEKISRHYKHPQCDHLFIEFATFPVAIGKDFNIKPREVENEGTTIKIYSPTDCVRDRLANYAYFDAEECLDQALLVADLHPINIKKVEEWSKNEGITDKFKIFKQRLKK